MDEHYFEGLTKPLTIILAVHFHELKGAMSPDSRLHTMGDKSSTVSGLCRLPTLHTWDNWSICLAAPWTWLESMLY
jgi:hypothetical protein